MTTYYNLKLLFSSDLDYKFLKNKDWKKLTESLLKDHYDPAYISNYKKKNQRIIKNFNINKVTKSELDSLANKILNL